MQVFVFVAAGIASWFNIDTNLYGSDAHVCAMNVVLIGTRVEVINDDNHRTSHCTVIGTGPFYGGRIFDAAPAVAADLGYDGLASVHVYRIVGTIPHCRRQVIPSRCHEAPPKPCVLDLPKPALVTCH